MRRAEFCKLVGAYRSFCGSPRRHGPHSYRKEAGVIRLDAKIARYGFLLRGEGELHSNTLTSRPALGPVLIVLLPRCMFTMTSQASKHCEVPAPAGMGAGSAVLSQAKGPSFPSGVCCCGFSGPWVKTEHCWAGHPGRIRWDHLDHLGNLRGKHYDELYSALSLYPPLPSRGQSKGPAWVKHRLALNLYLTTAFGGRPGDAPATHPRNKTSKLFSYVAVASKKGKKSYKIEPMVGTEDHVLPHKKVIFVIAYFLKMHEAFPLRLEKPQCNPQKATVFPQEFPPLTRQNGRHINKIHAPQAE